MIETDVAVVGGGPAGAAAAITLARAGVAVTVLDKATFPRDKICGDGVTTAALRILEEFGLEPKAVASWQDTTDVVVRAPSGHEQAFALPRGRGSFAVAARRADLDDAVLDLARTAGADVVEGATVTGTEPDHRRGSVVLSVDGDGPSQVRAAAIVAADGMWSPVRKQLGLGVDGYRGEAHAFRQYFTGVGERATSELYVSFERDLVPGYIWSFPLPDGGANVGFGIHRGAGYTVRDMATVWPDLLARPHIRAFLGPDAVAEGPHRAWPIPARIGRLPLSGAGGRVLFVGDAAAAVDVMSGEGIAQALQTGTWAAEAFIAAGLDRPAEAARRYEGAVREDLVPDDRMSRALVRLLDSPRGAEFAVRTAGLTDWTRRNFVRWLFEDEPGSILTPTRWRRDYLRRDGAYR